MMRILSGVASVVIALAACSSTTDNVPAPGAADASADATADASLVCGTADAASIRCQRGDACNCDDVGSVAPICVAGAWRCAPGSTRYEDCHGVPPVRPCTLDDAGVAHGGDGG